MKIIIAIRFTSATAAYTAMKLDLKTCTKSQEINKQNNIEIEKIHEN